MDDVTAVDLGERDIEMAAGLRLGTCANCQLPHLFLLDQNGDAFAEVVLDEEVLRELGDALLSMADSQSVKTNGDDRERRQ